MVFTCDENLKSLRMYVFIDIILLILLYTKNLKAMD